MPEIIWGKPIYALGTNFRRFCGTFSSLLEFCTGRVTGRSYVKHVQAPFIVGGRQ